MAPLISFLTLLLFTLSTVVASPHIARHLHDHVHRAIAIAPAPVADVEYRAVPLPRRRRSLNKRCLVPNNSTALPTSTAPINVAPLPTIASLTSPVSVQAPSSSSSPAPPPSPTSEAPAPTSSYVPPAPSSVAPASSSPPPPPPPSSSPPPPAQTSAYSSNSNEPSYMIGTQSGQGTYYDTGLGACGITNNDSQNIVAVSHLLFDSYPGYGGVDPNSNPVCGKSITASYQGKSVTVIVTDRCTGCQITDLDFSPAAFDTLADPSIGRIDITWVWD